MNLIDYIRETFSVEKSEINPNTAPGDFPEWDSLGHLNLLTGLEEKLGISFDMEETMSIESVQDLKNILDSKKVECSL